MSWLSRKAYVTLGQHLAGIRRQAGVTQDELAARLHKPQSFVSSYERGQRRVDLLEFLAIVDALAQEPREVFAAVLVVMRQPASRSGRLTSRR